ncbi:MAG: hypothetical protein M5U34_38895 [Chloroflexi bacterium]|nr:hypothetical protein [Chloroflexota bacterium]
MDWVAGCRRCWQQAAILLIAGFTNRQKLKRKKRHCKRPFPRVVILQFQQQGRGQ